MQNDATRLVNQTSQGVSGAAEQLTPMVYEELRARAELFFRNERPDHTLQPTALVHEAYLRLVSQDGVDWRGRTHFIALASQMMRRILIDHSRGKAREKRGGDRQRVTLVGLAGDSDSVALSDFTDVLSKFSEVDPRASQVVELRFFGGLTEDEVAFVLEVSPRTVRGDWKMAKAWLGRELERE